MYVYTYIATWGSHTSKEATVRHSLGMHRIKHNCLIWKHITHCLFYNALLSRGSYWHIQPFSSLQWWQHNGWCSWSHCLQCLHAGWVYSSYSNSGNLYSGCSCNCCGQSNTRIGSIHSRQFPSCWLIDAVPTQFGASHSSSIGDHRSSSATTRLLLCHPIWSGKGLKLLTRLHWSYLLWSCRQCAPCHSVYK